MALSTTTILSLAQVMVQLRTIKGDYESSAAYCRKNGKDNGVTFNERRVRELNECIALIEAAVTSK